MVIFNRLFSVEKINQYKSLLVSEHTYIKANMITVDKYQIFCDDLEDLSGFNLNPTNVFRTPDALFPTLETCASGSSANHQRFSVEQPLSV